MTVSVPDAGANTGLLSAASLRDRLAVAALGALVFAMWMLLHPYSGIAHDSMLYSLAALARLHPAQLGGDIFLQFGSQDRYTIFSPVFATVIGWLGLEPAAAVLTLAGNLAFFGFAALLARHFMPGRMALLAAGLLVVMPSGYGAFHVFRYTEEFLTPRLFAQALVLAGLAAALARRPFWAGACLLAAIALHPIMAAAGVAVLLCLFVALPRPKLSLAIGLTGIGVLSAALLLAPHGLFARFDATWLNLVLDRGAYLFLSSWVFEDWVRALIPLAVIATGALMCSQSSVRNVCLAVLLASSCGLLLTAIACDLFSSVVLTRMQPWRWLWLANVVAILFIPVIVRDCWRHGLLARSAVLLLANAWVLRGLNLDAIAVTAAVLALLAAGGSTRIQPAPHLKTVFISACAVLIGALLLSLFEKASMIAGEIAQGTQALSPLGQLQMLFSDGILPAALLGVLWWRTQHGARRGIDTAAALALAAAVCLALLPMSWKKWTETRYMSHYDAFAQWRRQIPPHAEVLWPGEPVAAWYWLERRNYLSFPQTVGIIFSREGALEMRRRSAIAGPFLPSPYFDTWVPPALGTLPGPRRLSMVCGSGEIGFIVTLDDLGAPPLATAALYPNYPKIRWRLYRCADFREPSPT